MAESQSRTELRALVDEFGELARLWKERARYCPAQITEALIALGERVPLTEVAERYERARRQAWLLLPPEARAECDGWAAFVEKWTGEPLPGSLPDASEASADAILRYLCGAPTDQAGGGHVTKGTGRPEDRYTKQRADFRKIKADEGYTEPETYEEYREKYPDDKEVTAEKIGAAYRRNYRPKSPRKRESLNDIWNR